MLSNHLILCCLLLILPSIFPIIKVFSNQSALHSAWPSIGASTSASVLLVNIQGWFPLASTGLISLQIKELLRLLQHHNFKSINSLALSLLYGPTLTSMRWQESIRWQEYTEELYKKRSSWPRPDHSPWARHPEMWSQVGLGKHHCKQSKWRWWNSSWTILDPKI